MPTDEPIIIPELSVEHESNGGVYSVPSIVTESPVSLIFDELSLTAAQYSLPLIPLLPCIAQPLTNEGQEPEQTQTPEESLHVPFAVTDELAMAKSRKMAVMVMGR